MAVSSVENQENPCEISVNEFVVARSEAIREFQGDDELLRRKFGSRLVNVLSCHPHNCCFLLFVAVQLFPQIFECLAF